MSTLGAIIDWCFRNLNKISKFVVATRSYHRRNTENKLNFCSDNRKLGRWRFRQPKTPCTLFHRMQRACKRIYLTKDLANLFNYFSSVYCKKCFLSKKNLLDMIHPGWPSMEAIGFPVHRPYMPIQKKVNDFLLASMSTISWLACLL